MSKEKINELQTCPQCKVGKMRPVGPTATEFDKDWKKVKGRLEAYKCDNCGYPQGGKALTATVNEDMKISDSTTTTADKLEK